MAKYGDQNGKSKPARKPSGVASTDGAAFRGYINLTLSQADKEAFAAWGNSSYASETLEEQIADGVNLALKRDPKGEGFLASGTQRRADSPNAGLCVTARGNSAALAWWRLVYCLYILSAHERWEDTQPLADPDRW